MKSQIDYTGHPKESLDELMKRYTNKVLVLDEILMSESTHRVIYQDLLDILKYGFEYEQIRHKPIRFKIHTGDKKKYELQLNNFLSNMVFWRAFVEMDVVSEMKESSIIDFQLTSMDKLTTYINDEVLPLCDLDFRSENNMIAEIADDMRAISEVFSILCGMGMSIYDIKKLEDNNPEVSDILYLKIDPGLQPTEIEDILHTNTQKLIDIFCKSDTDLRPLFLSGKNLSKDQFKEIAVKIGLKADINGNTIPYLIDCNILVDGICKPSYHYLEAMSARKALVLSKTKMGQQRLRNIA